ncbi:MULTISPECIES: molybdenum cofactor guanylyltransferase [Methanoculleus]|jgi:molybdopterin-guanine dinucleotide biosynthesis protein A|uniref:Probable molybdenum cofactor guanylyltransferase n=1 Tax=Methanoculleus thermophilus TaxID=2200 RepID=A0A1G8Y2L6_9EURY|nr:MULTISPECIES: molybdenum cofactor guanylyltransferase [Methanoculleus]NLN09521.1 molybdenum cofactor guanylyltransferase [Methanoculleus thermophilus]SDJ96953.1 molybdopterin-guanine dinucleotide biosynthesis protein A [Methanoculleus thermophilus]HQD25759.1 molybdenum cofactor guanylyltransferase [Methanoculleus thermophilus]
MRSAIVLVGGAARRAGGREKYFFTFQGKTFIERLIDTLREVVDEIVVVARDPEQCERFSHLQGVRCTSDIRQGLGPIGGLHAGTLAVHGEYIFVAACDMPCVHPGVVEMLFDAAVGYDAAIPSWNADMLEPLHAVYRRSALIEYLEEHESLSLRPMIWSLNTRYVSVEAIRQIDPDLLTFTNINNLEDLESIDRSERHCEVDGTGQSSP